MNTKNRKKIRKKKPSKIDRQKRKRALPLHECALYIYGFPVVLRNDPVPRGMSTNR